MFNNPLFQNHVFYEIILEEPQNTCLRFRCRNGYANATRSYFTVHCLSCLNT